MWLNRCKNTPAETSDGPVSKCLYQSRNCVMIEITCLGKCRVRAVTTDSIIGGFLYKPMYMDILYPHIYGQ